jgi:hypothetical protein
MKIQLSKIDRGLLQIPAYFAKEKRVDRKYIYELFQDDILNYIEMDSVMFVYLSKKTKRYKGTRNRSIS